MGNYSVAENFSKYFQIKFAGSKALRQEAFKIRYNVYADELGWEPMRALINKWKLMTMMTMHYHCLIEHKRTGVFAGCIRLVIPPINDPIIYSCLLKKTA